MKKVILLFTAMIAFTFANAQEAKSQKADAATRATVMTQKMDKVLLLTPAQKTQVQNINLESMKLMDLNQEKSANDPKQMEAEKSRIKTKWETDMSAVISADKMSRWKIYQAEEKAKEQATK
ncbi:MAG TPA: hypothetical protein VGC65_04655 [Bacteroidia bacterium]|jgi:hypothetical protein